MANVTKLSVSLPTPLAEALKAEARDRGIPLSQLLAEELERGTSRHLVQTIDELYGPSPTRIVKLGVTGRHQPVPRRDSG